VLKIASSVSFEHSNRQESALKSVMPNTELGFSAVALSDWLHLLLTTEYKQNGRN